MESSSHQAGSPAVIVEAGVDGTVVSTTVIIGAIVGGIVLSHVVVIICILATCHYWSCWQYKVLLILFQEEDAALTLG